MKKHVRFTMVVCLLLVGCTLLVAPPAVRAAGYLGPTAVVASADGQTLFVANSDAKQVSVVIGGKVSSIAVPSSPTGLVLSPDGATLYVTCIGTTSTVCAVDVKTGKVTATIPAGHTAIGPAISPDGKRLYVCNRFDDDVSVIDLEAKKEIARLPVTREPYAAAITPDGKSVFVINHLPLDPSDGYDVATRVTVIDTASNQTSSIRLPNGSSGMRGICVSPDGKYVYATHILARYQMPTTQLERGWMNTNALTIIDAASRKFVNTVLLDDVDLGAAVPWGVACTPDSKTICVTHASTHELSVIDATALLEKLSAMPADKEEAAAKGTDSSDRGIYASATAADVPNDLAFLVGLRRRVRLQGGGPWTPVDPVGVNGPRGLAVAGNKAYVALYFSDNMAVVDLEPKPGNVVSTVALGPKPNLTVQRRGEILFNDASICFQHWQSCASCHPDSRVDALNWDLMNDGLGNPKNARSMLLAHKTPPAMASGIRPDAEAGVRKGITHILFAVRPEEEAVAMDEYLKSMKPVPSPYLVGGKLSPAAEQGKKLFFDEKIGCAKCHPEPLYADGEMHDVASKGQYDRRVDFDTPTLIECWRTAPYMHDGHYTTMKDLFTKGKHGAKGGNIDNLSDKQIDDLVEFVLSL
ncbi:MAG: PD40 domain-containing protein [Candidatus Nealsonbacteria bacterium]|nr:PD40 domain-containing protein [Candidatus Nealsonbacteria bacterium]